MNDDDFAELFKKLNGPSGEASWEDVAYEVHNLGKTLGDAVRTAWQRQESNTRVRELQDTLQAIIDQFNQAVGESATTPEAQQTREQLTHLVDSIRTALDNTTKELRPELVGMLRQANAQLRKLTDAGE